MTLWASKACYRDSCTFFIFKGCRATRWFWKLRKDLFILQTVVLKPGSDVDGAVVMAELESLKTGCFCRLIKLQFSSSTCIWLVSHCSAKNDVFMETVMCQLQRLFALLLPAVMFLNHFLSFTHLQWAILRTSSLWLLWVILSFVAI
jgi:hypothetical protein